MPGEEKNPEVTTEKIEGIPLYLIPKAIADQIKKKAKISLPDPGRAEIPSSVYGDGRDLR